MNLLTEGVTKTQLISEFGAVVISEHKSGQNVAGWCLTLQRRVFDRLLVHQPKLPSVAMIWHFMFSTARTTLWMRCSLSKMNK